MAQRKPYNPNTKYGRRKIREQFYHDYENGSQEYRDDVDKTKAIVWTIAIIVAILFFILIAFVEGGDAALKWLK